MIGFQSTCARKFTRSSSSRTQGEAFAGCKGEPEDAEMRSIGWIIRVRVDWESVI